MQKKKNELNSFKSNILKNNIHLYVHLYQGNIDKKNKKLSLFLLSYLTVVTYFLPYYHLYFIFYLLTYILSFLSFLAGFLCTRKVNVCRSSRSSRKRLNAVVITFVSSWQLYRNLNKLYLS